MTEQKNAALGTDLLRLWPESRLQHIAKPALAVQLHTPAQCPGLSCRQRHAGVHGGFVVGGRLRPHQFLNEVKQGGFLASRPRQQGAHGDGKIGAGEHLFDLS